MKPLQDFRILAVQLYGAGPFGSVHLADLALHAARRDGSGRTRTVMVYRTGRGPALGPAGERAS
jgi:hypothetical protein